MSKEVMVRGRLAFSSLNAPKAINGGAPRYSVTVVFAPDSPAARTLKAAMREVAVAKWGDKGEQVLNKLQNNKGTCYRTEERVNKDGDPYPVFANMHHVSASSVEPPMVLDRRRQRLSTPADNDWPYPGCEVHVLMDVWAQDNQYGRRVNAALRGVQFAAHGEPVGGARPVRPEAFPDLSAEADEEDDDKLPF